MGLAGALLLAVLTGAGCASLGPPPANLAVGEGNLIHAEWAVDEPQPNARRISGYIVNTYYYFATQVQVMVGNVPPADLYRVTVPRYMWRDSDAGPLQPL